MKNRLSLNEIKVKSFATSLNKKVILGGCPTIEHNATCTVLNTSPGEGCSLFTGCQGCVESEGLQYCEPQTEDCGPGTVVPE